jgi:hypothetical protein
VRPSFVLRIDVNEFKSYAICAIEDLDPKILYDNYPLRIKVMYDYREI